MLLSSISRGRDAGAATFDRPDDLALRALGYLAKDKTRFDRFLTAAGVSTDEIREMPLPARHMTAVLDFLIADEDLLAGFSRTVNVPPELAYEARRLFDRTRIIAR